MVGKWKMVSSDNFDEYMKALDINIVTRKLGNTAVPTVEISMSEDGRYQMKTITTFKTAVLNFRLGEAFDEETADGRKVQTTMTMEENTLVHDQKGDKEKAQKDSVIRRTFDADTMTTVCVVGDITATRVYKRQA